MESLARGVARKLAVESVEPVVRYALPLDDERIALNPLLGRRIRLVFTGAIHCLACGRATRKSYCQGHCYPCSRRLAACDLCILKPEMCSFHQGGCREPEWGQVHCIQPHVVYLSNTSGLKVGITRRSQIPVRWVDQGAVQALPVLEVDQRLHAGLVERVLAERLADKTNWRAMLKGEPECLDLPALADRALEEVALPELPLRRLTDARPVTLNYPVDRYPDKVVALNLDKQPEIDGVLWGIKGQYLIFDTGVINLRKYGGYQLELFA